jgi:hypothetical protein
MLGWKNRHSDILGLLGFATLLVFVGACDSGPGESLFDPNRESLPDPVIADVQPPGSALAGVDLLTITGQNFSNELEDNFVYFGGIRGEVLDGSATSLTVLPPNDPREDAEIKMSVLGAENFSNSIAYQLDAAAEEFGDIAGFEEPFGLTSDEAGNLYASMFSSGVSIGIIRFAPDGARSTYVQSTFKWDDMSFGPDGMLYAIRGVRAIFRFSEGSAQETWAVIPDNSVKLRAVAFDGSGNLWAGGPNANLYRVAPDKSITEYPFEGDVTGLTVFGDALYATATQNDVSSVWRFVFNADGGVGVGSEYANISGPFGSEALSIVAATSGELFVGTDGTDPLILVGTDQSTEVFYLDILRPVAISLAWGPDPTLYMNQARTVDTDPDLIKINTRRQGVR